MVDTVGYTEPLHERFKPDAAGYDENQGAVSEGLKHTAQPTQKLIDPLCAVVAAKHSLEEYRQFVDDQKHGVIVLGAIAEQLLPVTPPTSGIQAGTDPDAKIERADFFDIVADPALHSGSEP